MKKIIVVYLIFLFGLLVIKRNSVKPTYFIQPIQQISPEQINPSILHIQLTNNINSNINNISSEIELIVKKQLSYKISGQLFFEKDKNLRILCWSKIKNEIDIGSNNDFFWFWSAKMKPPTLYYCPQSNISRNRLRTPFHPLWIMETLSIGNIDLNNSKIVEQGNNWAVIQQRISTTGEEIIKITLVSKDNPVIVGHYIFDLQGQMIVSTEIKSYQKVGNHIVPLEMHTNWYEENITLFWKFNNVKVNEGIDHGTWSMPNYHKQQDISL